MKITKVYTRTGDKGETSLVGGVRIKKSDIRLEAYGTVDELSAHLGMLVAMLETGEEHDFLIRVQNNLFNVCTHLATDQSQTPLYPLPTWLRERSSCSKNVSMRSCDP